MPLNQEKLSQSSKPQPELPNLKRPNLGTDRRVAQMAETQAQSNSMIAHSSAALAGNASQSLQHLDAQLDQFENRYAQAAVQRIAEVPQRINAKIANRLQQNIQVDPLAAVSIAVEAWEIPDLAFDCPTIAPATPMGCLPVN